MTGLYSQSIIKAGATAAPFSTSNTAALLQPITHRVQIVDGIATGAAAFVIYNWHGPHDIIDAFVAAMTGPNGEQIPMGAVNQNTHPLLTYGTNTFNQKTILLQIPAAGAALPANGYVYLKIFAGSTTKLNPPDGA